MAIPTASDRVDQQGANSVSFISTDADLPPVAIVDRSPITIRHKLVFGVIAMLGALAWAVIAFARGETVNAVWFVIAAICSYVLGFRFYARLIELKIVRPRDDHATPAEIFENGTDYLPTDRRVLFGHHFAAIAGAGPLVGPVLATQMGYLPSAIWIIIGAVLAGCVQDYLVLWASTRRRGRSLGQMARDELGAVGGAAAIVGILFIMVMLIAVLALIVVRALAVSPWGLFAIAMTIPIALFMGVYLRFLRPGRVSEVSLIGVALLLAAVVSGRWVAETSWGAAWFTLSPVALSWCIVGYGFAASVLPVWLLLAPRDYLSTFMKVGTIALLALGILIARPVMAAPAVSEFARTGNGPVFAGSLFPFLFITIACGALSGFHSLIASGTTPKLLEKEGQMRLIGYGGMLTESFVAVTALVTASILNQHLYFALNAPAALTGGTAASAADYVNGLGLAGDPVTAERISAAAAGVGEQSIVSRTGGAPTLAFGMAEVLQRVFGGANLRAFWYHFAIMFEALFILTTVDAGTRVARFMLSDALGNLGGPLRRLTDPSWRLGAWACSLAVVAGWGSILLMGVTDPLGGINTLYPLFGIANQLLAAIALTVVTVIVIKRARGKADLKWALIPGIPLLWDLTVTMTASWQKIFSGDPQAGLLDAALSVPGRPAGRPDRVRVGDQRRSTQRSRPQHLHPGQLVDRVRRGRRGGVRDWSCRGSAHNSRSRQTTDRGGTGAIPAVRTVRAGSHVGRAEGAGAVGRAVTRARRMARQIGWYWGTLLGDTHYRSYLEYRARAHPGEPVLSERDYWRRRYDGDPGARCC